MPSHIFPLSGTTATVLTSHATSNRGATRSLGGRTIPPGQQTRSHRSLEYPHFASSHRDRQPRCLGRSRRRTICIRISTTEGSSAPADCGVEHSFAGARDYRQSPESGQDRTGQSHLPVSADPPRTGRVPLAARLALPDRHAATQTTQTTQSAVTSP